MRPAAGSQEALTLAVEEKGMRFPAICPRCASPAGTRLKAQKLFHHVSDDEGETVTVGGFRPFFCQSCAAVHEREIIRPGLELFIKRVIAGGGLSFGATANLATAFFLTLKLVPRMFRAEPIAVLMGLGVLVFFYAIGIGCAWTVKSQTEYLTCPPPTSVTKSFDFTTDLSSAFEPSWRCFEFQNAAYAQRFRELNATRIWDTKGAKARRAASSRRAAWVLGLSIFATLLLLANREELSQWWERILEWLRL
jgi:hypothetical protein